MMQRRALAYNTYVLAGGKGSINSYWPVRDSGGVDKKVWDEDLKAKVMKAYNITP